MKPTIVCLCGSTRFKDEFARQNFLLTLGGEIVLSIGCDSKSDEELRIDDEMKAKLDELHLRKIDLADRVLILNVDGYIGESTTRELAYSIYRNKPVTFLDPEKGEKFMEDKSHQLGQLIAGFHRK
jgi:hypothetical protein